jgi:hypothetical protein
MMRRFLWIAALCAAGATAWAAGNGTLPLRRLALYIGSNDGGPGRATLRYAEEDARAMAGVLQELGGVSAEDSLVLLAPTADDVQAGFRQVRQRAQAVRESSRRVELVVYYSGHSDEQGLLLGPELFGYAALKSSIQEVQADVNIAILDSCSSGAFTRLKGGTRQPPFLLDESSSMRGHAYISSSSADEAAQESDRINGSFFTHFLISGLRGAADSTRDGQVSLNEAYHFAFNETLALTENTQGGAQHPSYNIQLTGTGDLTLTDLRAAACTLSFEEGLQGRLFVRNAAGRLVVELAKEPSLAVGLGLPEGSYRVTLEQGERLYEAAVDVRPGRPETLGMRRFSPVKRQSTVTRGDGEDEELMEAEGLGALDPEEGFWQRAEKWFGRDAPAAPEAPAAPGAATEAAPDTSAAPAAPEPEAVRVPFAVSFLPMVSTAGSGRYVHTLSLNLLVGSSWAINGAELGAGINLTEHEVRGLQAAGVGNILEGELTGYQAAGVFNIVGGNTRAWQSAGVFNLGTGPVTGVQAAGVFNLLEGPLAGAQLSGVFNRASSVAGAQVGLVNISGEVRGTQVGLVNVATGEVRGTQVGLVNIARQVHGLPIGLVNVSEKGGFHWSGWFAEGGFGYVGLQMSSGLFYTLLYGGTELARAPDLFAAGAGLGLRVPMGPVSVEMDLSAQHVFEGDPSDWDAGFLTAPYSPVFPTARLLVGLKVFRSLGVFGGVVFNGHVPGGTLLTPLHTGTPLDLHFSASGGSLLLYPKLVAGLRF